ncbi:uncharacterized protein LOC111011419 isoform X2 [Momordica charantia]|uniref:Uncharacterized protein LOC111011419 isoform X2 n=1 Tax=Momordica charantia TaxID=3673 RepID=A0A6J1CGB7_MOMCH|nr:uncharacterized protein LOC111011419 isoform X2 [Momordica charantia]
MGKQRYWSGHGRATRRLKNEGPHSNSNSSSSSTDHEEASSTSAGCTEAPRNSLESDEELPSPCTKQKDGLHIPEGIVQIKTRSRSKDSSNSDGDNFSGNSPSTKTPTLVARLMGLDLLPESSSPSTTPRTTSSSSVSPIYPLLQKPKYSKTGVSRSLPETPRTSCERKSNADQNYHHRLSLQIPNYDKENSTSPSHYAKEIVKQIKESVSRKSGLTDITNNYQRRDHDVMNQPKPKKISSSSSLSPKLRVLEAKNTNLKKLPSPKVEAIKGSKKAPAPAKKGNKQEEAFVVPSRMTKATIDSPRKKSKKTPLSNELLSFSSVPTVVMKKEAKPPPMQSGACNRNEGAETVTGDKESKPVLQLSTFHNNHKTLHHQHVIQLPNNNKHHIISAAADRHDITAEVDCVRKILTTRTNNFLENNTTQKEVPIWHPHYDTKLLCHLAEELLKPYVDTMMRPWAGVGWPALVEELCDKVRRYPRARCEVLEDIDGIIEKDMDRLGMGFEEEGEGIVTQIEEGIVEELLKETVRFVEPDGVV